MVVARVVSELDHVGHATLGRVEVCGTAVALDQVGGTGVTLGPCDAGTLGCLFLEHVGDVHRQRAFEVALHDLDLAQFPQACGGVGCYLLEPLAQRFVLEHAGLCGLGEDLLPVLGATLHLPGHDRVVNRSELDRLHFHHEPSKFGHCVELRRGHIGVHHQLLDLPSVDGKLLARTATRSVDNGAVIPEHLLGRAPGAAEIGADRLTQTGHLRSH